jgi:polyhydroxybutyrate depolymerase
VACSGPSADEQGGAPEPTPAEGGAAAEDVPAAVRSPGCDAPRAADPASGEVVIATGGASRAYDLYVPGGALDSPAALVVDLHGYQSGPAGQIPMSDFHGLAEREGFVVATPEGNGDLPYWNATPEPSLPDDVRFIGDVIDDVGARLCIDPARVYVDGFSNGAFMASLVACEMSDRVAAVAAVAGLVFPAGCDPDRAVPVLAIHGTADDFVSFEGSPNAALERLEWNDASRAAFARIPFDDVRASAATWATAQGCDDGPATRPVGGEVALTAYGGCDDGSSVLLYTVEGGGHTWPSSELAAASGSLLGHTTFDLDATAEIWEFFTDHPLPRRALTR